MVTLRPILELGRGGVGVVNLAVRGPGRELLVQKTLRRELARNVAVRRMFIEEARIASLVRHPAVVTIDDVGVDDAGVPWITMPWTPGVSLQTVIDTAGMPLDLHVWVLGQLLAGLSAVHTAVGTDGVPLDLVHRDVSPHNVLVTYDGDVKLLDFGIAKARDSAVETTTGTIKGKATYMAPEQLGRRRADSRADLFAVGVMLWQAVSGRRLWAGMNELEIFDRLSRGDVPPLAPDCEVSGAGRAVITRALMPDQDDRFVDAAEMRVALDRAWPAPRDARGRLRRHLDVAFREERADLQRRIERSLPQLETSSRPVALGAEQTRTVAPGRPARAARRWLTRAVLTAAALGAGGFTVARMSNVRADVHASATPSKPASACVDDEACGDDQLCSPAGECVSLATERCEVRRPSQPARPSGRPLVLGVMLPTSGALGTSFGRFSAHAAELAADEINRFAGGVPFGGERHPVTLVVCDDTHDDRASATHLATHVPAVIGFRASDEAITLSREVFLPQGLLVLSAMNASPLLAQLDAGEPRLLRRTRSSASSLVPKLVDAVTSRVAPTVAHKGPLRVACLRTGNATGLAFADQLMRAFATSPNVVATEIAASAEGLDQHAVDALTKLAPEVVLTVSDGLFDSVVSPYERALSATGGPAPVHVASWVWEGDSFSRFIAEEPGRRRRFLSLGPSPRDPAVMGLVERFRESFSDPVTAATVSPAPYDSVYLAAYAAAAARAASPKGVDLARAMERLRRGPSLAVGPAHVVEGMRRLSHGEEVSLTGVGSHFDFDPETGDASTNEVLLCTSFDEATRSVEATPASPTNLCQQD